MKWVIQNNLINVEDHDRIRDICVKHGYGHESFKVIPFSEEIPAVGVGEPTVFYGAA
jgi:hypothetical protein